MADFQMKKKTACKIFDQMRSGYIYYTVILQVVDFCINWVPSVMAAVV